MPNQKTDPEKTLEYPDPEDVQISFAPDSYKPVGSSDDQLAENALKQADEKFPLNLVSEDVVRRGKALEFLMGGLGVALGDNPFGKGLKRSLIDSTFGTMGDLALQWGQESNAAAMVTPRERMTRFEEYTEDFMSPAGLFRVAHDIASGGPAGIVSSASRLFFGYGREVGDILKGAIGKHTDLDYKAQTVGLSIRRGADALIRTMQLEPQYEGIREKFLYDLGSGTGSIATAIGIGLMAPEAGAGYFGLIQKAQTQREMTQTANVIDIETGQERQIPMNELKGKFEPDLSGKYVAGQTSKDAKYRLSRPPMTAREASAVSTLSALPEAGLEFIGLHFIMKGLRGYKPAQRTMLIAFEQALQEAGQQGSEEALAKRFWDRQGSNADIWKRIGYAAFLGLILGIPVGAISSMSLYKSAKGELMTDYNMTEEEADRLLGRSVSRVYEIGGDEAHNFVAEILGQHGIKFQAKEEIFFSAAEQAIELKMPKSATPEQIHGILNNTPGIKQEELEWLDIGRFLQGKERVTKDELLEYIRANNVQIEEVVKGDRAFNEKRDLENTLNRTPEEEARLNELSKDSETKFREYQLPGGENYKELLLTLPASKESKSVEINALDDQIAFIQAEGRTFGKELQGLLHDNDNLGFDSYGESVRAIRDHKDWRQRWEVNPGDAEKIESALAKYDEQRKKANDLMEQQNRLREKERGVVFKSGHFDEPNVLAHVRFNERTDSDGKRVLFIEEIQSDWHQQGRRRGYSKEGLDPTARGSAGMPVPNAPFKKTWHELALKRMLRYAAENGFDKIAWTTGEQQAERYDLSKQVDNVEYEKDRLNNEVTVAVSKDGKRIDVKKFPLDSGQNALADYIGKELAKHIYESKALSGNLEGEDLKVGGEGMKGFYDQIIPAFLNKYTKKWGGRVSTTTVNRNNIKINGLKPEEHLEMPTTVHSLSITPDMKKSLLQGQPKFQSKEQADDPIGKEIAMRQWEKLQKLIPEQYQAVFADLAASDFRAFADKVNKLIVLTKDLQANTVPHEIFHIIFGELLDDDTKAALLQEVYWNSGITDEVKAEEFLSDRFAEYWLGREERLNRIGGRIKQFIKDLKLMIKNLAGVADELEKTFADISRGVYQDRAAKATEESKFISDVAYGMSKKYNKNIGLIQKFLRGNQTHFERLAMISGLTDDQVGELHRMREETENRIKRGDIKFQEKTAEENKSQEREKLYSDNRSLARKKKPSNIRESIHEFVDKAFVPISTRLAKIDESLKHAVRRFDFDVNTKTNAKMKAVGPFLKAVSKLKQGDYADLDLALKNRDIEKVAEILSENDIDGEFQEVRDVLNDIHAEAEKVGMDLGFLEDYYPRRVLDVEGFLKYIRKNENWNIIQEAINQYEKENDVQLSQEEQAEFINKLIRGYGNSQIKLNLPGNVKDRTIELITPELNQFYKDSPGALIDYITAMTNAIESRRFFGKDEDTLDKSIGSYIQSLVEQNTIDASDAKNVRDILKARFEQRGTRGWVSLYKNLAYIYTMGSPISTITQIQDLAFAMYKNGVFGTGASLGKAITNNAVVKLSDLGLEHIAQEFEGENAVATVFKIIGLKKMDSIGKLNLIQGAYKRLSGEAKSKPAVIGKRLKEIFGDESTQVLQDLKDGTISDNVKYLLFSELADVQPISLSEMPEYYLSAGNLRILYMLKTYTLKQIDVFHNEFGRKLKENPAEALGNLIRLTTALMLMGLTSDEIKNILLGRKAKFSDLVIDNLLKLVGFSKWQIYKAREDGLLEAAMQSILPPVPFFDDLYKDAVGKRELPDWRIWGRVPVVGKFYYWWMGGGAHKKSNGSVLSRGRNKRKRKSQ